MKTVSTRDQIQRNLQVLEAMRIAGKGSPEFSYYLKLIERGRCFVAYPVDGELHFAPSRFVGYKGVTFERHRISNELDGKVTNPAISKTLGVPLVQNFRIDAAYKVFFARLFGRSKAAYQINRKYWPTSEAVDFFALNFEDDEQQLDGLSETERTAVIKARVGQANFRKALITKWQACPVTGCTFVGVLRASHIKPWSESSSEERLDPNNGVLLTPNLDLLFDLGFITFDEKGELVCATALAEAERPHLLPKELKKVVFNAAQLSYLSYHRTHVFLGV